MSLVVCVEKSKVKIKLRTAIISMLCVAVFSGIVSYAVNAGVEQGNQDKMETIYELANSHYASGNYLEAIAQYDTLSPDFAEYTQAMELRQKAVDAYVDSIIQEAEGFLQGKKYVYALNLLDALKSDPLISNEPVSIVAIQNQIEDIRDSYAQECIAMAHGYWQEGNIGTALTTLQKAKEICGDYLLLEASADEIKQEYRDQLLELAENQYSSEGYEAAVAVLSEGLNVLPQNKTLTSAIETYLQKKPARPLTLDYYVSGGNCTFSYRDSCEDIFGNTHYDLIGVSGGFSSSTCDSSQTYRIDGKYKRMTGTVILGYDIVNIG